MAVRTMPLSRLALVLAVGLIALGAAGFIGRSTPHPHKALFLDAAQRMQSCLQEAWRFREARGLLVEPTLDPNHTGLIGAEYADFTTTLGNIEAKRTSTNPAFAAVLTRMFLDLELQQGDAIAVGASGSFPALTLATLCAAHTLGLETRVIYSLGASMYGAGESEATFLELLAHWRQAGLLSDTILAVSLGGDNDQAEGLMFDEMRDAFLQKAYACGLPFINQPTLEESASERVRLYGKDIRCFVNVGGASVNMGDRGFALRLPAGVIQPETLLLQKFSSKSDAFRTAQNLHPSQTSLQQTSAYTLSQHSTADARFLRKLTADKSTLTKGASGMIAYYTHQGVPAIHLLDIRHLALKYGLPLDPKPFPPLGDGSLYQADPPRGIKACITFCGLALCLLLLWHWRSS